MGKHAGLIQATSDAMVVQGDEYGIRNGWFNHPFNFDPTWLRRCDGFEPVEPQEDKL